jgi:hypothetical protein
MITSSDFLHIPYTPDLSGGGIAYAIRSLPYTYDRMGGSSFDRLRRIVAGVAVELAFRRHLSQADIPYDVKGATPFTDPDRYDVSLGGHRCDIKSFLISHRRQISSLRTQPELLLKAPALVPLDQYAADGHRDDDLYLFAFLSGLIAASQGDLSKALDAGQPAYLMHAMPKAWSKPVNWQPLNPDSQSGTPPAETCPGGRCVLFVVIRPCPAIARRKSGHPQPVHERSLYHRPVRLGQHLGLWHGNHPDRLHPARGIPPQRQPDPAR